MDLELSVQSVVIGVASLFVGSSLKTACPACPPCPSLSCEQIVWFPAILAGITGIFVGFLAVKLLDNRAAALEADQPQIRFLRALRQ